mmetsp:Transcript_54600/g.155394  ORF Transcript_54600/g.155394 Transcript_54600/m.155394 type:complete len:206 (-) Transcript_54600:80-697(-)
MGVLHELLAQSAGLGAHRRAEHHHLLLLRGLEEDLLNILSHVDLVKALVALIKHELCQLVELEVLLAGEPEHPPGRADQDVRAVGPQHLAVLREGHAAVDRPRLDALEVLREAAELELALVGQLSRVADHQHSHGLLGGTDPLQAREQEGLGLPHAGPGLARDVGAEDSMRDALVLDFRRALGNGMRVNPISLLRHGVGRLGGLR